MLHFCVAPNKHRMCCTVCFFTYRCMAFFINKCSSLTVFQDKYFCPLLEKKKRKKVNYKERRIYRLEDTKYIELVSNNNNMTIFD